MPMQRNDTLDQIRRDGAFDVVVVGGGINGIGVYRDLALQGLRVLLVERNDFCSGCSAAPSRMIHGGLRYLENGEFDLVWESLRERDALLVNAPHMVRPLPTTIPIATLFSGLLNGAAGFLGLSSRPASRGALPIKIGLMLYDWTTRHRRLMPTHNLSEVEIDNLIKFLDWVSKVDNQGWPPRPILVAGGTMNVASQGAEAGAAQAQDVRPVSPDNDPRALGEHLFRTAVPVCTACHSLQPGVQLAGPSMAGVAERAAQTLASPDYAGSATDVTGYIRESIVQPSAHLVPGDMFSAAGVSFMPNTYVDALSEEQIDQLVAYLSTLR